jgi:hypothetical protein
MYLPYRKAEPYKQLCRLEYEKIASERQNILIINNIIEKQPEKIHHDNEFIIDELKKYNWFISKPDNNIYDIYAVKRSMKWAIKFIHINNDIKFVNLSSIIYTPVCIIHDDKKIISCKYIMNNRKADYIN